MMNLRTVFLLGMLLGFGTLFGQVDWLAYRPAGYVSDYAQVFDSESKEALNALIADLNAVHSAQIAVLVVPSLQSYNISELATFFYDYWQVGSTTNEKGALFIYSVEEPAAHLHIGAGLKGVLTPLWEKTFAEKISTAMTQSNQSAIYAGVKAIIGQIHGKGAKLSEKPTQQKQKNVFATLLKKQKSTPVGTSMVVPGGQKSGLPMAAIIAAAFGGFLLLSTLFRAKAYTEKSVYDYGRDFERGRTGPFGNKTPRWQK